MDYNKLGKTQLTNQLKIIQKKYTPQEFLSSLQKSYLSTRNYQLNQIVSHNNRLYISILENNKGNQPTSVSKYWKDLQNVNNNISLWNEKQIFSQGTLCFLRGKLYISLLDNNIGNNPEENVQYWSKYSFSNIWSNIISYPKGQFISFSDSLYFSLQDNNLNNRPDISTEYWQKYSQYGSKVEALLINLNGEDIIDGYSYQVFYDKQNYIITIKHNLNGRVQGVIYDNEQKQAFYGIDYVDLNTVSIQMNEYSFPNSQKVWKIGLCLGTGFSVRMVNYDDTIIRQTITSLQQQIIKLKRQIATLSGGLIYIGDIDLSSFRQ